MPRSCFANWFGLPCLDLRGQRICALLGLFSVIVVHKFAIAIGAFNPAMFIRNLQPNPRVAALSAIAGNAIAVDDLCFRGRNWGLNTHRLVVLFGICPVGQGLLPFMSQGKSGGKRHI
jgi:hypothetical protein